MRDSEAGETPAFAMALRLLARRDHSEQELRRKLRHKGCSPEGIDEAVEKLKNLDYLDDRRFAASWVEAAVSANRFFGGRLSIELVRRGIPRELAEEVVRGVTEGRDETMLMAELLQRKFPRFNPSQAAGPELRKIYNYMLRKGFSPAVIMQVLRQPAES